MGRCAGFKRSLALTGLPLGWWWCFPPPPPPPPPNALHCIGTHLFPPPFSRPPLPTLPLPLLPTGSPLPGGGSPLTFPLSPQPKFQLNGEAGKVNGNCGGGGSSSRRQKGTSKGLRLPLSPPCRLRLLLAATAAAATAAGGVLGGCPNAFK